MDIFQKKLRNRFCNSYPIQVVHSPYFEERINLLNKQLKTRNVWDDLTYTLYRKFDGNVESLLNCYDETKQKIISSVRETKDFEDFNNMDMAKFSIPKYPNTSLYTEINDGERFISIDLSKANFQAINFVNSNVLFNCGTYTEFINRYTDVNFFINSKYLRERIFGELNPKRTSTIEKYIIHLIITDVLSKVDWLNEHFDLFLVNNDEIVYKLKNKDNKVWETIEDSLLSSLVSLIFNNESTNGIIAKVEKFTLVKHQFEFACSDAKLNVYQKCIKNKEVDLLYCCPNIFYTQVYKLINDIPLTENDLVFYNNHELAKFLNPLQYERKLYQKL